MQRQSVAVLGSTGPVGQKIIALLEESHRFRVAEVAAPGWTSGLTYGELVEWDNELPLPERVAALPVKSFHSVESRLVISALPTEQALVVEPALVGRGHLVFSTASAHRMNPRVPLLVPPVNARDLELLSHQGTAGRLITTPGCATVFLASALAPLSRIATIEDLSVFVTQPSGFSSYAGSTTTGAEDRIREEVKRLIPVVSPIRMTVHVQHAPHDYVLSVAAHVRLSRVVNVREARAAFEEHRQRYPGSLVLHEASDAPITGRDLPERDTSVHVGRLKQDDDPRVIGFIASGNGIGCGIASAAIANMDATLAWLGATALSAGSAAAR